MKTSFSAKIKSAYEHGKADYTAGSLGSNADIEKVKQIFKDLHPELDPMHLSFVIMAWIDGWVDQKESMQDAA